MRGKPPPGASVEKQLAHYRSIVLRNLDQWAGLSGRDENYGAVESFLAEALILVEQTPGLLQQYKQLLVERYEAAAGADKQDTRLMEVLARAMVKLDPDDAAARDRLEMVQARLGQSGGAARAAVGGSTSPAPLVARRAGQLAVVDPNVVSGGAKGAAEARTPTSGALEAALSIGGPLEVPAAAKPGLNLIKRVDPDNWKGVPEPLVDLGKKGIAAGKSWVEQHYVDYATEEFTKIRFSEPVQKAFDVLAKGAALYGKVQSYVELFLRATQGDVQNILVPLAQDNLDNVRQAAWVVSRDQVSDGSAAEAYHQKLYGSGGRGEQTLDNILSATRNAVGRGLEASGGIATEPAERESGVRSIEDVGSPDRVKANYSREMQESDMYNAELHQRFPTNVRSSVFDKKYGSISRPN